jgi:hypothetical protein
MKVGLWALRRWWVRAWERYLDDLACLLIADFEAVADGGEGCDDWHG